MAEKKSPLVSICIPTYNGEKYITETLTAACEQSYENIEIIISDDGSTDDTLKVCKHFSKKNSNIKIFKNAKNLGLVENWKKSIALTSTESEWIKFLFQDDLMHPTTVAKMLDVSLKNNIDFTICDREYLFEEGVDRKLKKSYDLVPKTSVLFSKSKKYSPIETGAIIAPQIFRNTLGEPPCYFFKKKSYVANNFDLEYLQLTDYIFCLNHILEKPFYFINEKLVQFRVHNNSQTSKNTHQKKASFENHKKNIIVDNYERIKICYNLMYNDKYKPVSRNFKKAALKKLFFYLKYRIVEQYDVEILKKVFSNTILRDDLMYNDSKFILRIKHKFYKKLTKKIRKKIKL